MPTEELVFRIFKNKGIRIQVGKYEFNSLTTDRKCLTISSFILSKIKESIFFFSL